MNKKIIFLMSLVSLIFDGPFVHAAAPEFMAKDPIGRTLVYDESGVDHFLTCFCIERVSAENHDCKRSQFAQRTAAEVTHDFLGNTSFSWIPVASPFDADNGNKFYGQLATKGNESFRAVWDGLFNSKSTDRSGYSEPVRVQKKSVVEFIDEVEAFFKPRPLPVVEAPVVIKPRVDYREKVVGKWQIADRQGNFEIKNEGGKYSISYYISHHYVGTVQESTQALSYDASENTFSFQNKDGDLNTLHISDSDGLISIECQVYTWHKRQKTFSDQWVYFSEETTLPATRNGN